MRRRRRAAALCESTQGRGLQHVRSAHGRNGDRIHRPDAGHAAQPGADRDAARRATSPTLFSLLDTCCTAMGSAPAAPLAAPSAARPARRAQRATQAIAALLDATACGRDLCARRCGAVPDIERITARIALRRRARATWPACATASQQLPALRARRACCMAGERACCASHRTPRSTPPADCLDLLDARDRARSPPRWCATAA